MPKKRSKNIKRRRRNRQMSIPRSIHIVPDKIRVKLKYVEVVLINSLPGNYIDYRGNGPNDPNVAFGGGQPTGFDQWAAFYNRYQVKAAKCDTTFVNIATTGGPGNVECSIIAGITDVTGQLFLIDEIITNPNSKTGVLAPVSAGGNPLHLTNYQTTKSIFSTLDDDDEIFSAATTTVPNRQWYFHVQAFTLSGSGTTNLQARTILTYYMEFYARKQLEDV